ncbi:ribosomal protein L1 [Terfezia boudieri ATCC MYA-4762]|uniref:Ribosomal protein L1 n=1 Tax=Terfezia boudieri ATCC MYA-4762 TaxID=1051890 RepID=A0A3N4LVC5_9PEZI|nr:ribosomal protein L1 [Terfezia boudieri ATCC MYA-4762]
MAPSAKNKKAAKSKTAAANAAAAALSKANGIAKKAVVPVADDKPKAEYDSSGPVLKTKVPAGSSLVTAEQVLKAARALLKFLETQSASAGPKKPNLLDDEAGETGLHGIYRSEQVWLVVTTLKNLADKKDLKPKAVKIPYPLLNPENISALLLVKDPQRVYKDILLPSSPTVRKVLGVVKLRAKFKTYETLRQLRDTHDLILADERITPSLREALGSSFLRTTTKIPIPVRISKKNGKPASQEAIEKEVKKAVEATYIHLAHTNSTNVRVGLVKHSAEQLVENVLAVIEYMITEKKCVKAGWKGVRGVYIKSGQSTALPLYLAPKIYSEDKDVTTAEKRKEEKEASAEKKKANEVRRKAKVIKMAAKKGTSMVSGALETNGMSGVKAVEPALKKRKVGAENKNNEAAKEEVDGTPKSKKQKIVTAAMVKKPAAPAEEGTEAAPTIEAEIPEKESKFETAAAPAPAVKEKKEDASPNISKAKAAKASRKVSKEAKTQEAEAVEENAVVEKKEEANEAEKKPAAKAAKAAKVAGKRGKAAKPGKPEEEKVEEKKEEPKRRSKRVSTGGKA